MKPKGSFQTPYVKVKTGWFSSRTFRRDKIKLRTVGDHLSCSAACIPVEVETKDGELVYGTLDLIPGQAVTFDVGPPVSVKPAKDVNIDDVAYSGTSK